MKLPAPHPAAVTLHGQQGDVPPARCAATMHVTVIALAVMLAFGAVALVPDAPWSATGEAEAGVCNPLKVNCEPDVCFGTHDDYRCYV